MLIKNSKKENEKIFLISMENDIIGNVKPVGIHKEIVIKCKQTIFVEVDHADR
jgi:hypothetical protein